MTPDTTSPAAIDVRRLTKTYPGGVEAVRGIDLTVARGEVLGLLGPNGAGKSTLVGMLTTTIAPTSGRASVVGHDVATDPLGARRVSAVVFQEPQPGGPRPAVGPRHHGGPGPRRPGRRGVRARRGDRPPGRDLQRRPAA